MIDIQNDQLLTLYEAAAMFPATRGGHIEHRTVRRWITHGCRGIKLEYARVGSKLYTTVDALRAFSARLAAAETGEYPLQHIPSGDTNAAKELAELGFAV